MTLLPLALTIRALNFFTTDATSDSASASASAFAAGTWSGPSSPTSAESLGRARGREGVVRGPWDHSGSIRVPFDVGAVLPPPMPAAVGARGGEEGAGAVAVRGRV